MPAAVAYDTIRVSTYGGPARSKPSSSAIVSYRMPKGGWYTQGVVSSGTGYHAMPDYDVRDYTVVLRYEVLG